MDIYCRAGNVRDVAVCTVRVQAAPALLGELRFNSACML